MKYAKITKSTTLQDIAAIVGQRNVETTLHLNNMERVPKVGERYIELCRNIVDSARSVTWEQKKSVLSSLTDNSDVFETASLLGQSGWKLLNSSLKCFPGYYKIPETVEVLTDIDMLGDGKKVSKVIFDKVMKGLESSIHDIDPSIFSSFDTGVGRVRQATRSSQSTGALRYFKIPFGDVSLYSSLSDDYVDFPCYPEDMSDAVRANFTQMPDILYQYEPWMVYNSSGPRANTYTFDIHRDMWDDHNNGKANELIRFCEANCYPQYNGSAVHAAICTLYIKGRPLIRGVVTEVSTQWDGPLGHDGFYLHVKLSITIQEVSNTPLTYDAVKSKKLIG